MKKAFTLLLAAVAALTMTAQPLQSMGKVKHNLQPNNAKITKVSANSISKTKAIGQKARTIETLADLAGDYVWQSETFFSDPAIAGGSVSIAVAEDGTITINNLWDSGIALTASYNEETSKLVIPSQVVGNHTTYGDYSFCKATVSSSNVTPDRDNAVTATIYTNAIVFDDNWGIFIDSGTYKDQYFDLIYSTYLMIPNGAMEVTSLTSYGATTTQTETYPVLLTQESDTVIVSNFGNNGCDVKVTLLANNIINIPGGQTVLDIDDTNTTYQGDFVTGLADWSAGSWDATDIPGTSTTTELKINQDWGAACPAGYVLGFPKSARIYWVDEDAQFILPHTYTVAGSPAGFFGTSWDTTNEANDMTLNAETGKYEWTSTEATLDAGANVEFKVAEDHSWDVSYGFYWGADNVVLTAEKAGKYTLTVYFDPQNNNNVTGELTFIEEAVVEHTYTVAGSPAGFFGTEWDTTNEANDMTLNEETGKYEWTSPEATLDADANVQFKVAEDHSWDVSYGLNGGGDNVVLTAEKAGKYTLTVYFDPQNNNNVTGELTLIEEIVPEYSEFYVVGEFNDWNQTAEGGRVALEEKEAGVYEATLNLEAGEDGNFKVIAFDEAGAMAWFGGADENNVGFFLLNNDMLGINISLAYGSAGVNFRPEVAGNYTIQVFEKPATTGLKAASEPLVMKVVKNADTAIETISTSAVDNTWYNLQGVKFNGKPSVPGIYINGGKKVIVK